MCANPTTTIQIQKTRWRALNALKQEPGEDFDTVIERLITFYTEHSEDNAIAPTVSQSPQEPQQAREEIAIPDSVPDRFDERDVRQAINAAVDLIMRNEGASMREIVTTVGQDHPLDYEIPETLESGERYRGAYWRKILKPALEADSRIRKPKPHESEWQPV